MPLPFLTRDIRTDSSVVRSNRTHCLYASPSKREQALRRDQRRNRRQRISTRRRGSPRPVRHRRSLDGRTPAAAISSKCQRLPRSVPYLQSVHGLGEARRPPKQIAHPSGLSRCQPVPGRRTPPGMERRPPCMQWRPREFPLAATAGSAKGTTRLPGRTRRHMKGTSPHRSPPHCRSLGSSSSVNVGVDRRAIGGRSPPTGRPCRSTC